MSFDEFLHSPYERAEWVDGEVFELSPENLEYQGVMGFLHPLVWGYVEERGLGRVFLNCLMKTGPDLAGRAPDLAFLARRHENRLRGNYVAGPVDLAVEVVSPDSTTRDRVTKRREYEEGGVSEYWLIDPIDGQAHFLSLQEGRYRPLATEADGRVRSLALPGFWLKPEWLLGKPRPRVSEVLRLLGV
jgi:Uma2 family endonuclease